MVQGETSRFRGYANSAFPKKLAVGIVSYAFWRPVEAILMIAVLGAEWKGRGAEEFVGWDLGTGMDDEEEVGGFGRILIEFRKELDVDLRRVALVL